MIISSNLFAQNIQESKEHYNYAKSLYLSEQFTRAVYQFDSLVNDPHTDRDHALAGLAASLWMLGDTKAAVNSLNEIKNKKLHEKLQTAFSVSSGDLKSLKSDEFTKMYLTELNELEAHPDKSPGLAGLLSAIIPGAGHVYLGAYQSAAIVLAFNLLTGISAIEFADKDLDAPAVASGVLFSIFYAGGIYSSYEGAKKINHQKILKPKKELSARYFPILKLEF